MANSLTAAHLNAGLDARDAKNLSTPSVLFSPRPVTVRVGNRPGRTLD